MKIERGSILGSMAAACAALLVTTGCSHGEPKAPVDYQPPAKPSPPPAVFGAANQVSSFIESDLIRDEQVLTAVNATIAKCMASKGLKYLPHKPDSAEEHRRTVAGVFNILGPTKELNPEQRTQNRDSPERKAAKAITSQPGYKEHLSGGLLGRKVTHKGPGGLEVVIPLSKCKGEGYLKIYGSEEGVLKKEQSLDDRSALIREVATKLRVAPPIVEALPDWRRCMKSNGHSIDTPWGAPPKRLDSKASRQLSLDIVKCKEQTKFGAAERSERPKIEAAVWSDNQQVVQRIQKSRSEFLNLARSAMSW